MANYAVVPVPTDLYLDCRLAGRTLLDHLLEKLREVRDLAGVVFCGPTAVLRRVKAPEDLRWKALQREHVDGPLTVLRQYLQHEGHLQDTYLFCHPAYPLLPAAKLEHALVSVLGERRGAVTLAPQYVYAWKNGAGLAKYQSAGINACVALRGDVPVQQEDLWFFGESVQYIPLTAIEAVNAAAPEGLAIAQALTVIGEL